MLARWFFSSAFAVANDAVMEGAGADHKVR